MVAKTLYLDITGPYIAQSVARPIADPGVVTVIPARSHTFMEIDYEIIYIVILLPLIQEGNRFTKVNRLSSESLFCFSK